MILKVSRSTRNKVVTLELSTACFTDSENEMLDQLGEPVIEINKSFGNNPIKFAKKVRSNFRIRVKFDANLECSTDTTADYIEEFLTEIRDQIEDKMSNLLDEYNCELRSRDEILEINY